MKKRFLTFALLLLLAVLMAFPVHAASATVKVNSVTAQRGDTVTMTATLSSAVTVGSGSVELSYDSSVLELVSGTWNVSGMMLADFDSSDKRGVFAFNAGTKISGKVFTATFKVKSNAAFGASTVKMTVQLKDGSNADMSVTNNSGKVTVECKHSYSDWSSTNSTSHERTCSVCKNKETKKHSYDNACDTKCNDCGRTRDITHSYKTTWSSNSSKHWHECSVCKAKKDDAAHTPGAAATETTAQTCTVCGYVIKKALGHTHKPTGDWLNDAASHWHDCSSCDDHADEAAHDYDNECDTDCNTCGYVREVTHTYASKLSSDAEGHWYACTVCGAKDEVVAHTAGPEATEETPQLCTVCEYEIAPPKAHEHEYAGEYLTDADDHWQMCKCGESSEKGEHSWDAGVVDKEPTATEAGQKIYTCSVCNYKKLVELELVVGTVTGDPDNDTEKPSGDDTTDSVDKDDDDDTATDESGLSVTSLVIGIAIGIVVGAGVGASVVSAVKRKSSIS